MDLRNLEGEINRIWHCGGSPSGDWGGSSLRLLQGVCQVETFFIIVRRHDLLFHSFFHECTVSFSRDYVLEVMSLL